MTASAGEIAARREIWVSFTTLLRVYLAAAALPGEPPQVALVEGNAGLLHVDGLHHTMKLDFQVQTGEGYWALFHAAEGTAPVEEGAFRLSLDGSFTWSGRRGAIQMDALAEALATLVMD